MNVPPRYFRRHAQRVVDTMNANKPLTRRERKERARIIRVGRKKGAIA
jgi:hypothetical protein